MIKLPFFLEKKTTKKQIFLIFISILYIKKMEVL